MLQVVLHQDPLPSVPHVDTIDFETLRRVVLVEEFTGVVVDHGVALLREFEVADDVAELAQSGIAHAGTAVIHHAVPPDSF